MVSEPQIALDVEQLMSRIRQRVEANPDSLAMLDSIQECRRYADGICEFTMFSDDVVSRTKSFIYKCVMRALSGNLDRQRRFNHSLVDTLQLIQEDLDKIQRRLAKNNDGKIE